MWHLSHQEIWVGWVFFLANKIIDTNLREGKEKVRSYIKCSLEIMNNRHWEVGLMARNWPVWVTNISTFLIARTGTLNAKRFTSDCDFSVITQGILFILCASHGVSLYPPTFSHAPFCLQQGPAAEMTLGTMWFTPFWLWSVHWDTLSWEKQPGKSVGSYIMMVK